MALSDDAKIDLTELLLGASPEQLDAIKTVAERLLGELKDLNSTYLATQEFLEARGLTHVRELDKQGLKDLQAHLQATLDRIRGATH